MFRQKENVADTQSPKHKKSKTNTWICLYAIPKFQSMMELCSRSEDKFISILWGNHKLVKQLELLESKQYLIDEAK